jgi:hypothetical protein
MGLRSRLEKQPTDFRQSISYFADRTLGAWSGKVRIGKDFDAESPELTRLFDPGE